MLGPSVSMSGYDPIIGTDEQMRIGVSSSHGADVESSCRSRAHSSHHLHAIRRESERRLT